MKFLRQQGNFKKRLEKKWKKPKGRHSKLREKRRGLHKMPGIGFKQSDKDRKKTILVHNLSELKSFNKGDVVTLASSIGTKSKIALMEYCLKNGVIITNHKKVKDKIEVLKQSRVKKVKKVAPKPKPKPKAVVKKKVVVKKKKPTSVPAKKMVVVKKEDNLR